LAGSYCAASSREGPPASALMAIHVLQECHRRCLVETRRRFPVELLAFLPFPPAPRASLPASIHSYVATVVAHIRAHLHNSARRMLPTPKNRNQKKVLRIHTCRRSLLRRSARNAIRAAVLLPAERALPKPGLACVDSMDGWQTKRRMRRRSHR
jgi:hypothetical protein